MNDFQRFLDENLGKVDLQSNELDEVMVEEYDIYVEIRQEIIALRKYNRMTQKELASRTGLTQANVCNMEKGSSKPTIETLKKIADATGTRLTITFAEREIR